MPGIPGAADPPPGLTPDAAAGWGAVRDAVEADGALSAARKALLVAAVAAVQGDVRMAAVELRRGFERGLEPAEARRALPALLLARGEPAYRRLAEALAEARPGLLEDEGEPEPEPPAPAEADAYFTSHFGSIPPRQALLSERAPAVYEGYFRLHRRVLGAEPGRAKQAELLMLALNAAALQPSFTAIHMQGARRAGASEEELVEAVLCAIPVVGIAAWPVAAQALTGEL
jgi:4-carboxymuconolactone decarboxylase